MTNCQNELLVHNNKILRQISYVNVLKGKIDQANTENAVFVDHIKKQ